MTNKKSTKRALLVSAMAMVICFTMLLGTTFAWFTDSVTNRNNIIKSGNLDVTFEYYDETANSWDEITPTTKLFDDEALWEPGYTDVLYVRVRNTGSLALNYRLGVKMYDEYAGINVASESFLLSDYIKYGVESLGKTFDYATNKFASASDAVDALDASYKLSAPYASDEVALVAESGTPTYDYYAIVVYMPGADTGNVANHNGTNIPKIFLGVNVAATQMVSESDDFGTDYDDGAVVADPNA